MSKYVECIAMYNYTTELEDELTLMVGDIIRSVQKRKDGWWHGRIESREGVFPINYVETVEALDEKILSRTRGEKYIVMFPYDPVMVDELELIAGQLVEVLGEDEPGWWRGKVRERLGVFPSCLVSLYISSEGSLKTDKSLEAINTASPVARSRLFTQRAEVMISPVVLKRIIPISANLFDPEDEPPIGPVFGSPKLSSNLDQFLTCTSPSISGYESKSRKSLLDKITPSFGGKTLLQKFVSSGSLFEGNSSTWSPITTRRSSVSAFFKRNSPTASNSTIQRLKKTKETDRTSPSCDKYKEMPGMKPLTSTPAFKQFAGSKDSSIFSYTKITEKSMKWDGQEEALKLTDSDSSISYSRPFVSSGDSGVGGCDVNYDLAEELFGTAVEIKDDVFEDIFKYNRSASEVSKAIGFDSKETPPTQIKTSFSNLKNVKKVQKRNLIITNPSVKSPNCEGIQVTEL